MSGEKAFVTRDPETLARINQSWADLKEWDNSVRNLANSFPEHTRVVFHTDPFEHMYCGFSLMWDHWNAPEEYEVPKGWRYYKSEKRIAVNRALLRKKDPEALQANAQRRAVWLPKTQPFKVILKSGMAVSSSYKSADGGTRRSRPVDYLVTDSAFYVQFDYSTIDQQVILAPEGVWEPLAMSEYWAAKEGQAA